MYQSNFKQQNAGMQLVMLLFVWGVFTFLGSAVQMMYIKQAAGVSQEQLASYVSEKLLQNPEQSFVVNALYQIFTFLLPALAFALISQNKPMAFLGLNAVQNHRQTIWVVALSLGLVFAVSSLGYLLQKIDWGTFSDGLDERRERFMRSYLQLGKTGAILKSLVLVALIPAFCEEIFFRGVLMRFCYSFFKKWWLAVLATSIIFTLFHSSITQFLPILFAAVILGYVYYLTGSLWLNILLHFMFNGIQLLGGISSNPELEKQNIGGGALAFTLIVSLGAVTLSIFYLYKQKTPLPQNWNVVDKT